MADFQKHQIKRESIDQHLPLRIANYLDFQQQLIKESFSHKSRFVMAKSEVKTFTVDDEFVSAFKTLSLDEKIAHYAKQVSCLSVLLSDGREMEVEDHVEGRVVLEAEVKGKGLGSQWQQVEISVDGQKCSLEIPHKSGIYNVDLHDYLLRESDESGKKELILEASRPNIIKQWRLVFKEEEKAQSVITAVSTRAMRSRLQEEIKLFRQSRVVNTKSNFKKKSQIDIMKTSNFDVKKVVSQVMDASSMMPDRKRVVFESRSSKGALTSRKQDHTLIDTLEQGSFIEEYEQREPNNLFPLGQDWFTKTLAQGSNILNNLFGVQDPESVFQSQDSHNIIYQNGPNSLLQSKKNPHRYQTFAHLNFPREIILAAICEVQKYPIWNPSIEEGNIKLRVPTSNVLIMRVQVKPLGKRYRPREFLYLSHFFRKDEAWYVVSVSIRDSYYPVEGEAIRSMISKSLVRLREEGGRTQYDSVAEICHEGKLDPNQKTELCRKYLSGIFELESCLKDRVFVENKAGYYFDLNRSSERASRFTLGKNNALDDTDEFTENLCSEICSFYSAQGPADWGNLDDFEDFSARQSNLSQNYEQRPYSFKKKNPESRVESLVGGVNQPSHTNQSYHSNEAPRSKLPFAIPIKDNKVILSEENKLRIESYIRQKEQERIQDSNPRTREPSIRSIMDIPIVSSSRIPHIVQLPEPVLHMEPIQHPPPFHKHHPDNSFMKPVPSDRSILSYRKASDSVSNISVQNPRPHSLANSGLTISKRRASRIDIDKHNPEEHIVPFSEVKIHPDNGQVILPDEYLDKWVSTVPITCKKLRPYKGDHWDHYLFRDLWTVLPNGDMKCVNQAKLSAQSSAIKLVLKRFASNVMNGKGILNVSLPVEIFSEMSGLQLIGKSLCFAPYYLEKASNLDNSIERFKIVTAFSLATSLLYLEMEKPFNPILGETYQGWIAGCPVYCEQISHHPAISAFFMVGKGYTVSGRLEPKIDLSLNSGVGENVGEIAVVFDKYPNVSVHTQSPAGEIGGLAYGDRKFSFTGKSYSYDSNGLFCELSFNPTKKGLFSLGKQQKETDYVKGAIYRVDPSFIQTYRSLSSKKRSSPNTKNVIDVICEVEGRWTQNLLFGGVQYLNVARDQPTMLEQQKYPLNSNSNYREDIYYRRQQDYNKAQAEKERLEVLQRNDKKLRQRFSPHAH